MSDEPSSDITAGMSSLHIDRHESPKVDNKKSAANEPSADLDYLLDTPEGTQIALMYGKQLGMDPLSGLSQDKRDILEAYTSALDILIPMFDDYCEEPKELNAVNAQTEARKKRTFENFLHWILEQEKEHGGREEFLRHLAELRKEKDKAMKSIHEKVLEYSQHELPPDDFPDGWTRPSVYVKKTWQFEEDYA